MNKDMIFLAPHDRIDGVVSFSIEAEVIGFLAIHPKIIKDSVSHEFIFMESQWQITHLESGLSLGTQPNRKYAKRYAESFQAKFIELGGSIIYDKGDWVLNAETHSAHTYALGMTTVKGR